MQKGKLQAASRDNVIGGILLIAGSCIGAGMLGLPISTGLSGFYPSLIMFAIACFVMTVSGLYVVEVHQWFSGKVHFSTMVNRLLGPLGNAICWTSYLFLFYSLLVAYIALSGKHFSALLHTFTGAHLPDSVASVCFVILFGIIVYFGTRAVDLTNRFLMVLKIGFFLLLILLGLQYIHPQYLHYMDTRYAFFSLPMLITSFGFQNVVPTLSHYLGGNTLRLRQAILGGSLFVLIVYLLWEVVALGAIPVPGTNGILDSYHQGTDAATALKNISQLPRIGTTASIMAFVAILTSFLAQSITLTHFLEDGFKLPSRKHEHFGLCLLTLVPPLLLALLDPTIFFKAMNFAGGICAIVLFGILPPLMVWVGRYHKKHRAPYAVFGGKVTLIALLVFSAFIFFYQLTQTLGFDLFPKP